MRSKLFTPGKAAPDECFVNPPMAMSVNQGFADAGNGGALYPLKLDGSGVAVLNRTPKVPGVTTSDDPQYNPENRS